MRFGELRPGQFFGYDPAFVALKIQTIDVIGEGRKNAVIVGDINSSLDEMRGEAIFVPDHETVRDLTWQTMIESARLAQNRPKQDGTLRDQIDENLAEQDRLRTSICEMIEQERMSNEAGTPVPPRGQEWYELEERLRTASLEFDRMLGTLVASMRRHDLGAGDEKEVECHDGRT